MAEGGVDVLEAMLFDSQNAEIECQWSEVTGQEELVCSAPAEWIVTFRTFCEGGELMEGDPVIFLCREHLDCLCASGRFFRCKACSAVMLSHDHIVERVERL